MRELFHVPQWFSHVLASVDMGSSTGLLDSVCRRPFEGMEILWDGSVHLCIPGWLPVCVGNVSELSIAEVWNSSAAKELRESVRDGSFSNCLGQNCPYLTTWRTAGRADEASPIVPVNEASEYARGEQPLWPVNLSLSYDYTCTLDCEMCRSGIRRVQPGSQDDQRFSRITDEVLRALPHVARLNIGLNGEPFDSRHYMRILSALHSDQHPNLQVALLTNGLGLTKQRLSQFEQRGVLFESVEVAVDAATAETYEALRRRGRFPVLLENLSAISEFRRRGAIRHLALSYVVQASNYREMASFVSLANQVGVDRILFRPLDDWKVMSAERFAKKAVHDRRHPEHEQFRALLADPIFQAKSIDLGGLGALIADEPSGQVT